VHGLSRRVVDPAAFLVACPPVVAKAKGEVELERALGPISALAITVGGVIGSGIFLKPWEIARQLPNEQWVYSCWIALGLTCLFGTFAYAELGCMFPEAGGQYAFLREGWGRFVAFLYGWCFFWVINTGTVAALAVALADTLGRSFELGSNAHSAVSLGMILVLAAVNHFGVRWGALLQNLSTFAKLAALAALVLVGVSIAGRPAPAAPIATPEVAFSMSGLIASCVAIFWAYEGWHMLSFSAAEVKNPERNLPRGFIYGMLLLIATYVAVNWAYASVVSLGEMRTLESQFEVPRTAVERILGPAAAEALALMVALSIFGSANSSLLSAPRGFYAMAKDELMPRFLTRVHPVYRTPTAAIWVQALWSGILVVVLKEFRDITEYVIFAALIFYALAVGGVLRLRRTRPDAHRPYRCWGYPITPLLFIAVAFLVDVYALKDPVSRNNALLGLVFIAAGAPIYWFARQQRS
jgi:APA family basic amino acid/polyamine antiporter